MITIFGSLTLWTISESQAREDMPRCKRVGRASQTLSLGREDIGFRGLGLRNAIPHRSLLSPAVRQRPEAMSWSDSSVMGASY